MFLSVGFWCLQEDNQITVVQQPSREVYLSWSNQSWVNERAFKNLKSPIIVRWGEIKTIPFMNLHKLITNETSMTLSDIVINLHFHLSTKLISFVLLISVQKQIASWSNKFFQKIWVPILHI